MASSPVGASISTTAPKDVSISKASPATEYERSLRIVLGTIFGVFGFLGILIIGLLLYRCCKNRNRQADTERNPSLQRSVSIDLEQKQVPSVLLLYSYDCCAHEKVVEALAGYLIETCNCNVHLDIFEEQIIHERGLDDWLVEKLQEAEFIIVLSSVGARIQCCKKKVKFKLDPNRSLPDYFAVAVDYVAEKMRVERSKGMSLTTFCVAYMDYSSENDIPPQLEMAFRFCLMKDITALFSHLHGVNGEPTKDGVPIEGISEDTYDCSELGQELKVAIESAKEYFRSNPGWVEDRMEPVPNPCKKSRHARKSSLEPLLSSQKDPTQLPGDDTVIVSSELRNHTLPKLSLLQQMPLGTIQNRQNSFPSSLSSHQTLSTPPLHQSSKSCDNFTPNSTSQCDLSGTEGHAPSSPDYKGGQLLSAQEYETEDNFKSKSKSMPTMNRNSLYSSQTIFQAEVHKAWDDQDSHLSQADSQDTVSNHDSIVDDLERDLNSIINPAQIMPSLSQKGFHSDNFKMITELPLTSKFSKVTGFLNESPHEKDSHAGDFCDTGKDNFVTQVKTAFSMGNKKSSSPSQDHIQLEDLSF